jgi:hypothetical protein
VARKRKKGGLLGGYLKGLGTLVLGAATLVGGVFAWRFANMLFDKMLEKKETTIGRLR